MIELYKDFDIDWNTDAKKLKPEDFPILSDLYNKLLEKASVSKEEGKMKQKIYPIFVTSERDLNAND